MEVCILAVTKAFDEYCIAGMTPDGQWVRPIPATGPSRFWKAQQISAKNNGFLRPGDVLEFTGQAPNKTQYPNHTEDIHASNLTLKKRLTNDQLIDFLSDKHEDEQAFKATVNAKGRSLCLVKADSFEHYTQTYDDKVRPLMSFTSNSFNITNPHTRMGDYIVKDCRWIPHVINGNATGNLDDIYLCIGLATPWKGVEYPQVIGLHTSPGVRILASYPN
ncbi:dual OB domain-containing protein [Aneurinibacillus tyrosinisolvens]|uniref:dual OB domain-containing protein n=1 Tax=Aneurinibacillus tyrosinisolvens TaxID=1443435 RepID=UPI00063F32D2|nr:hypothetical protein [Aneurinibacillus tyrosinisolvens]